MQRIDTSLTQRIINQAVGHQVPVSSAITSINIICGTMNNYDDSSSHDTILMLFQNQSDPGQSTEPQFSQSDIQHASQKLITILHCQKLVSRTKTKGRGIIPVDFPTAFDIPAISKGKFADDHFQWLFLRYKSSPDKTKETNNQTIPTLSSLKSILSETSVNITHITITPILPYQATNYDAIYTILVNFQDVLKQKQQVSGALLCDKGVYHIAKELQLLYNDNFNNIFLRLGDFHMEEIVLNVIGQFLSNIGVHDIFVQNEIYRPAVTNNKVMTGSHYVFSCQAFRILHEAVNCLQFSKFERRQQKEMHLSCLKSIQNIRNCFEQGEPEMIKNHWNTLREEKEFDTYQTV